MKLRSSAINRLGREGPAAWLAAGFFVIAFAAVAAWLSVVLRMETTNGWLQGQVAPVAHWLPGGGVVVPRSQMFGDSLRTHSFSNVWEVVGSPPFIDRLLVFAVWHSGLTLLIMWLYWWRARPSHLGRHAGASIGVRCAAPRVLASSAVFAAVLCPIVYLLHGTWFALNLSLYASGGERLATGIPLALGHAGVGGIWLGAIVAHAAIIAWRVRATVTAAVERNETGLVLCGTCGYALTSGHVGVCSECGAEHKNTPARFHLVTAVRCWPSLRNAAVCAMAILLYCAPLTLSMLGRMIPHQIAEPVAQWWYSLF
jgi:hypothetical protein